MERWSAQVRAAMAEADGVARRLAHDYVGTEHLLAGLAHIPGVASRALASLGLDGPRIEAQLEATSGRGTRVLAGSPPRTAEAGLALARSRWEARALGAEQVSSAHVLLALLRQPGTTAPAVLQALGVDPAGLEPLLVRDGGAGEGDVRWADDAGAGAQLPAGASVATGTGHDPDTLMVPAAVADPLVVQVASLTRRVRHLEDELAALRTLLERTPAGDTADPADRGDRGDRGDVTTARPQG